jgi:mannose/cellobiose epimerase-like protein (N-acyl-D-glucosamine 2-epimerase family)
MKRRNFLGLTGAAALSPVVSKLDMIAGLSENQADIARKGRRKIKTIAGYTPEELLSQYRAFLFEDFLPFMEKYVIDHELGGFLWNIDRDGSTITTHKRAWYDGRGIWVYSFLYNNLKKDPKYLETARKAVDFVLRIKPVNRILWPASYTRDGKELNDFPQDIYGDLFIAEGLAEFSEAVQDPKYRDNAKQIIFKCLDLYDHNDFSYIVDYGPQAPPVSAPRITGHWMVFLRTCYCLLSHGPDNDLEKIVSRSIDALINYHYNREYDLINEVMNHDLSRPEGPFSQFVYAGHVIETMWMIMYEAVRIKDNQMFNNAVEKFKRHVEVAWDDVYGGVFRSLDNVNDNIWKVDKVLWEQSEVLIGALFLIELTSDPWAYHWFEKMYSYVMDKYPLKKYGYSLWNIDGDRKMTFVKQGKRIENYHHPRHLMLNILSLERIIKGEGKIVSF